MTSERLMPIHEPVAPTTAERTLGPEFTAMAERVAEATALTSRLNVLPVDPEERRLYLTGGPIDVAENVWIGAGATILPGVSIGRDAVVAAGAVVADDVPARSLVTGPKAGVHRSW